MSEFDFEELDKAVKGALGTTPSQPVPPAVPQPASINTPRPAVGRFMDIVPSSRPVPQRPDVSRPVAAVPEVYTSAPVLAEEVPSSSSAPSPLESPFLPGAKVEKRPLGAPENDSRTPEFNTAPSLSIHEELEAALQEEVPEHETVTLPDPLAFAEAQQATSVEVPVEPEVPEAPQAPPEPEASAPIQETSVEQQPTRDAPTFDTPAPAVQASIPQQYTEQSAAQADTPTAIYNPDTLHQPLLTAGKKHSGVWTVLWILLLVLLGAAAGGAFYWFVLPLI